jgi:predicted Asp-tRNA(Asn)/Glu-tRNA(Gln) amidotransferase subunit C
MEEKERQEVAEEAKKLLEKFSRSLEKVKSDEEFNVVRDSDRRTEKEGKECNEDFRKIMLENAPTKNEDFIIAEKKTW